MYTLLTLLTQSPTLVLGNVFVTARRRGATVGRFVCIEVCDLSTNSVNQNAFQCLHLTGFDSASFHLSTPVATDEHPKITVVICF